MAIKYLDMKQLCKCLFVLIFCLSSFQNIAFANEKELKVMSYNVLTGFNNNDHYKQKFKSWIEKELPDVIGFQEMSKFTAESFKAFAKSYGHEYTAFMETGGCCPIALSSKYPISDVKKVKEQLHHGLLMAKILDYNVMVLHLNPFDWEKRAVEIQSILEIAKPLMAQEKVIMMGDFNSLSAVDSQVYSAERLEKAIKGKSKNINNGNFDYSVTAAIQQAGFIDTFWQVNKKFSLSCPTKYYATSGTNNPIRIDYIWVNGALKEKIKKSEIIYNPVTHFVSDHYPVLLTLSK